MAKTKWAATHPKRSPTSIRQDFHTHKLLTPEWVSAKVGLPLAVIEAAMDCNELPSVEILTRRLTYEAVEHWVKNRPAQLEYEASLRAAVK